MSNRYFVCTISGRGQIDWYVSRIGDLASSYRVIAARTNSTKFVYCVLYGVLEFSVCNYVRGERKCGCSCNTGHGAIG